VIAFSVAIATAAFFGINALYYGITLQPYPGESLDTSLRAGIVFGATFLIWFAVKSVLDEFDKFFESTEENGVKSKAEPEQLHKRNRFHGDPMPFRVEAPSKQQMPTESYRPPYADPQKTEFNLNNVAWLVLNAAQGSFADAISTDELAERTKLDRALVFQTCQVLAKNSYLGITVQNDLGSFAMVRITHKGLLAIKN
jgi:hypothetical protein